MELCYGCPNKLIHPGCLPQYFCYVKEKYIYILLRALVYWDFQQQITKSNHIQSKELENELEHKNVIRLLNGNFKPKEKFT